MGTKNNKKTYWKDLKEATQTTAKGLGLTWEHFLKSMQSLAKNSDNPTNKSGNSNAPKNQSFDATDNSNLGIVTNLYPHETMPIPDNGRYKLHNEIEDCILCNKCAEICPVDCIEIEAIRGTEQVGKASDGSPIRFYAAKFDIDMAKCFFCGLCTVVCPTESLTMTKEFNFSQTDVSKLNYEFGNLNEEEIIEKQKEWDTFQAKKEASKKPIIKPILNSSKKEENQTDSKSEIEKTEIKKPIIKIKLPAPKAKEENQTDSKSEIEKTEIKKPIIKIKLPTPKTETTQNKPSNLEPENKNISSENDTKKIIKIKIKQPTVSNKTENKENQKLSETNSEVEPKAKKIVIKIKLPKQKTENKIDEIDNAEKKASDSTKSNLDNSKSKNTDISNSEKE